MAVEGRTHKPVIDHARCGGCAVCLDACPAEIIPDLRLESDSLRGQIYAGQNQQVRLKEDAAPALARCQRACPLLQDVRGYIRLIAAKKYQQALELIRAANPLPSVCGYVCHHPCESACTRGQLDQPLAIKALKRFVADFTGHTMMPVKPAQAKNKRVDIIGSGPAGLAAAYALAKMGYQVEIWESYQRPGGLLTWAIPAFRLPRDILQRDIDFIIQSGVQIHTNRHFGRDITLADLEKAGTAAVIIATGTQKGLRLQFENEGDYQGYLECLSFLRAVSEHTPPLIGKQVIVVGGGNAAMDTARSALKLGAAKVTVIYRRGPAEMPADRDEVRAALAEGVLIQYLTMPVKFILDRNKVIGLICAKTELSSQDDLGRPKPVRVPSSEFDLPADTVIAAIGQQADHDDLAPGLGKKSQKPAADASTLLLKRPNVFMAGDFATGPSTVVEAMADGQKAAQKVDQYLRDQEHRG